MDTQHISQSVAHAWDADILPTLREYIRIPSKSPAFEPDWDSLPHMRDAVDLLARWVDRCPVSGLTCRTVTLPGRTPLLYAGVAASGASGGTVLMYGHYDKQPEFDGWAEGLGPWQPVMRDGKLYGRGGADDGYALFASLTAIAALQAQGAPQPRCVVLIEGCEESGSYDLPLGELNTSRFPWAGRTHAGEASGEDLVLANTWWPSLAVVGLGGAPPVAGAGNTLRPATMAKLVFRLPPTLDADTAAGAIKEILENAPPHGAEVGRGLATLLQQTVAFAAGTPELCGQELHLVTENPTGVGQCQVFGHVRRIGQRQQFHTALVRQAIALVVVAALARRNDVVPLVAAAARARHDMVARERGVRKQPTAVQAHAPVAAKQGGIGERRYRARMGRATTATGDDAVDVDARPAAVDPRMPAKKPQNRVPVGPLDQVPGIQADRFLPSCPVHGRTGHVQP